LPTEAQWEKAAWGTDGRVYPWGNAKPNDKFCNFNGNVGDTTSVDKYPKGASPYGCLDMAGNVCEWVADWYDDNYDQSSPKQRVDIGTTIKSMCASRSVTGAIRAACILGVGWSSPFGPESR